MTVQQLVGAAALVQAMRRDGRAAFADITNTGAQGWPGQTEAEPAGGGAPFPSGNRARSLSTMAAE